MIVVHSVYPISADYQESELNQQNTNVASNGENTTMSFAEHLQSHIQQNVPGITRYTESQVAGISSMYWGLLPTPRYQIKSEPTRTREDLQI